MGDMTTRYTAKTLVSSVSALAAVGLLVACGADDANNTANDADTNTGTESVTETETVAEDDNSETSAEEAADSEFTVVDVETFAVESGYVFRYETDGTVGECSISETGASCVGTAADEVPDIQVPPFEPGRPGAVFVGAEGVDYTVLEGVPPAEETLEPGQQVSLDGTTCAAVDASTLECTNGEFGFTISGPDRMISTNTEPIGGVFVE